MIKAGAVQVTEVPPPALAAKEILVRVERSCISSGTELAGMRMSGMPLYRRALKQPENVAKVMMMVKEQGLKRTLDRVQGKLAAGSPTGYSAAGIVVAVGDQVTGFAVGERVACAGAGIANHAEYIAVPVNLAVAIPPEVDMSDAATVTLGAIALQGVRRANPTLGETFLVIGLGILGQLTVQFLAAQGCRVIGVDLDRERLATAKANGLDFAIDPNTEDTVERVHKLTDGFGADGTIITAASASHSIIREAMNSCRRKGRVVLVGDVGLDLKREDFYKKELDFLISSSYGPGRYDPVYEEGGQDYPLPFVRWTENRNMAAYLALLAQGRVKLSPLQGKHYPIDAANQAYADLNSGDGEAGQKPLYALLDYPERKGDRTTRVAMRSGFATTHSTSGKIRVALVGASSFAQAVHLPNLAKLKDRFVLRTVMSRTGSNARAVAQQHGAEYCTSDLAEVLADDQIDLVLIANRHNLHGDMTLAALRAGKHVFVEKPLALTEAEVAAIEDFYRAKKPAAKPYLMVGYNRRFSPAMAEVKAHLQGRTTPMMISYRMNVGFIPSDSWIHGAEGGGRNLGEACHIYDLFCHLVEGATPIKITATSVTPSGSQWQKNDNFIATIAYSDGSVASLTYCAMGHGSCPKEYLEIICDGKNIIMDDFRSVTLFVPRPRKWKSQTTNKGQFDELKALGDFLAGGDDKGAAPIELESLLATSRIALEVERQIMTEGGASAPFATAHGVQ
ncbi:MAG: bi-domain-containing oxidoreductase [Candidatus Pacebacteria bacterium]|nr:bi-domain-containing oxidoreductase [Candidatus Paceibacterota bacterium]